MLYPCVFSADSPARWVYGNSGGHYNKVFFAGIDVDKKVQRVVLSDQNVTDFLFLPRLWP